MNTQHVGYKANAFGARKLAFLFLVIVLLLSACAQQPQPARIEEITFQSGEFTLFGELRTPAGTGAFPVVLLVNGSGLTDCTFFGGTYRSWNGCWARATRSFPGISRERANPQARLTTHHVCFIKERRSSWMRSS